MTEFDDMLCCDKAGVGYGAFGFTFVALDMEFEASRS